MSKMSRRDFLSKGLSLGAAGLLPFPADAWTGTRIRKSLSLTQVPPAITLVGSTASTAPTMSLPSGLQQNDLVMIFSAVEAYSGPAPATPDGYTVGHSGISEYTRYKWSYKFMGATPDTSANVGGNGAAASVAVAFRGVHLTTPLSPSPLEIKSEFTNVDPLPITISGPRLVVVGLTCAIDPTTVNGPPAGYTLANWICNTLVEGPATTAVAYKWVPSAGTEDPGKFSLSGAWYGLAAFTIALNPASI